MEFLKKIQNKKNEKKINEFEDSSLQNKSIEEIYKEKKRRLKFEQSNLENEKELNENDTRIESLNNELNQIQQQIQSVRTKNRKCLLKFILLWGIISIVVTAGYIYYGSFNKSMYNKYKEELGKNLSEYNAEIDEQTQNLQQEIETLKQQFESLEESAQ